MRRIVLSLFSLLPLLWGCHELLLPDEPGNGPTENFEFVWEEVDRHYSFFQLKELDWAEIGDYYRQFLTPSPSSQEFFFILSEMLGRLQDGHVALQSPFGTSRYTGWYSLYRHNFDFDVIWNQYLTDPTMSSSGRFYSGWLGQEIGYVYVPSFEGSGWIGGIEGVLDSLKGTQALVLDIRDNSGGSDSNSEKLAGRVTAERRLYRRIQYRNGPDHGDFSRPEDDYLEPVGRNRFTGPVAVLTNRRTFSAAESFVLAMRATPNVTVVGDVTGGGSGNPIQREMPNGWTFTISRWIEWAPDGTTHEGVGLEPDLPALLEAHRD